MAKIVLTKPEEIAAHPLISRIPKNIWMFAFYSTVMESELQRMDCPFEEAIKPLDIDEDPFRSLLCLMIGHPEASNGDILRAARQMGLEQINLFLAACVIGKKTLVFSILSSLSKEHRNNFISFRHYYGFRNAAEFGHLNLVNEFISLIPKPALEQCIAWPAFNLAVKTGQVPILERFFEIVTDKLSQNKIIRGINRQDNYADAVIYGQCASFEYLIERLEPHEYVGIIGDLFKMAVREGHLDIVTYMMAKVPPSEHPALFSTIDVYVFNQVLIMRDPALFHIVADNISKSNYADFAKIIIRTIAKQGTVKDGTEHLRKLFSRVDVTALRAWLSINHSGDKWRIDIDNDQDPLVVGLESAAEMVIDADYVELLSICDNGHFDALEALLEHLSPEKLTAMLTDFEFYAYTKSAVKQQTVIFAHLIKCLPKERQGELLIKIRSKAADFPNYAELLGIMINSMHVDYHQSIWEECARQLDKALEQNDMPKAKHFDALIPKIFWDNIIDWDLNDPAQGDRNGLPSLEALDFLISLIPHSKMIKMNWFDFCQDVAFANAMELFERLRTYLTAEQQQCILERNVVFRLNYLVSKGHVIGVNQFLAQINPTDHSKAVQIAYDNAQSQLHWKIAQQMLENPACFLILEGEFATDDFVEEKMRQLRTKRYVCIRANPTSEFDLESDVEAKQAFYLARYYARKESPVSLNNLRDLISFPAVAKMAHTEVTPGRSNELLREALIHGNVQAAQLLFTLPAVKQLAEQNDCYKTELYFEDSVLQNENVHSLLTAPESESTPKAYIEFISSSASSLCP